MSFSKAESATIEYYAERYAIAVDHPLIADKQIRLSDHTNANDRRCRFCGLGQPETTFRKTAHAVPEFLGNKSIVSMNECDLCNTRLADQYEDHLAKWFGPLRAISQMQGKNGVPTYKADRIRIESGNDGPKYTIVNAELMDQLRQSGPIAFKLPVATPSQPYVPIRAAMALMKIACSTYPAGDLHQVQPAIDWLMGRATINATMFPILHVFTPGPNPNGNGRLIILRRKVEESIPYLWCIVATSNYRFQFFVPFCPADQWLKSGEKNSLTFRHFPVPFGEQWPHGKSEYSLFDWAGTVPVVKTPDVTLHVESADRCDPDDGKPNLDQE